MKDLLWLICVYSTVDIFLKLLILCRKPRAIKCRNETNAQLVILMQSLNAHLFLCILKLTRKRCWLLPRLINEEGAP